MENKKRALLTGLGVLVFWIAVWWGIALVVDSELFLPSPLSVLISLSSLVAAGSFWVSVLTSLLYIICGFAIGTIVGIFSALLACRYSLVRSILAPAVSVVRSVPVASFIILVYVFVRRLSLEINFVSVVIVALMVLPIMWGAVISSYKNLDKGLLEVGRVYGFSFIKRFTLIYIPSSRHTLAEALQSSVGLAWKAGIAAEVICRPKNTIGNEIGNFKSTLEMDEMIAMTLVVAMLSMLLEKLVKTLIKLFGERKKT